MAEFLHWVNLLHAFIKLSISLNKFGLSICYYIMLRAMVFSHVQQTQHVAVSAK